MPKKYPTIATADEIRSIAKRAIAAFDVLHERDDSYDWGNSDAIHHEAMMFRAIKEAMRFCATSAAILGDPSLSEIVADLLDEQEGWKDNADTDTNVIAEALGELLKKGGAVTSSVEAFAKHTSADVRAAIAGGLRPTSKRAIALLEKLALDPIADVRSPAKEALATLGEVPWWLGKFQRDPLASLSPEEAEALREPLEKISAMLDLSRWELIKREESFTALVAALPDAPCFDVIEKVLSAGDRYESRLPRLGAHLLSREGGVAPFIRVLEAWGKQRYYLLLDDHVAMLTGAPPERTLDACWKLATYALTAPAAVQKDSTTSPYHIAADLVARAMPAGADLAPLLEMLLAASADETMKERSAIVGKLSGVFDSPHARPGALTPRLLEARLAGYPGPWSKLGNSVDKLLSHAPREQLRPAITRALQSDNDQTATWGLQCLLTAAYDPEIDGLRHELASRLCEDARLRQLILSNHSLIRMCLPPLRAALRRGELDKEQTHSVISALGSVWGEVAPTPFSPPRLHERVDLTIYRQKEVEKLAPYFGPAELQGPITEEEWSLLRRTRDTDEPASTRDWFQALYPLPKGPWHPEDRALLDSALAAFEEDEGLAMLIAGTLAMKPAVENLPLFDRLLSKATRNRGFIQGHQRCTRERLGLPPTEGEGATRAASDDWMDEDDDDDDDGEL